MNENDRYSILVVDDEPDLCNILRFNLEMEGYKVSVANSAEEAMELDLQYFDLLLLDVMMGKISGFEMAKSLKTSERTKNIPIIFLTARDTENDVLTGLGLGADDYVSKPFSVREVMLRVKAVLRRTAKVQVEVPNTVVSFEGLVLDTAKKTVMVDGVSVPFTKTEFSILHLLLTEKGRVVSRSEMISRIWPDDVLVLDRTVDVNITRVRKKISPYSSRIVTRSGFGYYFEA